MKQQQGFTLIELVVVIVILGILAVTAAPRFINLQDDARDSTLAGLKGAIDGANALVYSKAAIEGNESAASSTADGVVIAYGYMQAKVAAFENAMNLQIETATDSPASGTEWLAVEGDATITVWPASLGGTETPANCFLTYTEADHTVTDGSADIYKTLITACGTSDDDDGGDE